MASPSIAPAHIAACLAVALGAGFLGLRSYEGLAKTSDLVAPESTSPAAYAYAELSCVNYAFRSLVPAGSTVFIDITDPLWHQLAVVAAFPDRTVVKLPEAADFVLMLRPQPLSSGCAERPFEARRGPTTR